MGADGSGYELDRAQREEAPTARLDTNGAAAFISRWIVLLLAQRRMTDPMPS